MNSSIDLSQENRNLSFLAVFIQIISLMFLSGWLFNAVLIRRVDPAIATMNPLTALNFVWISMLILLTNVQMSKGAKKYLYLLISIILAVPIILTISDLFLKTTFNADRMFFDTRISTFKMSIATAINFILIVIGLCLLNFTDRRIRYALQYLVVVCLYTSLIYFFAYLYNLKSVVGVAGLSPMPLHTSVLFIMVCIGLLFLNSEEGFLKPFLSQKSGGFFARRFLPIIILLPFIVGFVRLFIPNDTNYSSGLWASILSITILFLSAVFVWYIARMLNNADISQTQKEEIMLEKIRNLERSECLLIEMGKMAKIGIWEIFLYDDIPSVWSEEIYSIYKFKSKELMNLETAMRYYKPESRKILMDHFHKAMTIGTPYDLELKLITSNAKEIWVHTIGNPIFDSSGHIIGVRGVLQDIDDLKRKEFLLQVSINLIEDQNKRLLNFSHTVSHNLMAHSKNLKSTLDSLSAEKSDKNKVSLIEEICETSESINVAIEHLNEVVRIETNTDHHKMEIKFENMLKQVTDVLQSQITKSDLTIISDFSGCETINYLPAYLESIFMNLTTNTIKYKQEGAPAVINMKTNIVNGKPTLIFSNGIASDFKMETSEETGLYKTFTHANARGTWLSLTKSQVESLGGNIEIQNVVDQGTTFKITFY